VITTFHRTGILFLPVLVLSSSLVSGEIAKASIQITFSNGDAFDGKNLTLGNNTVDLSSYFPGLVLTNQALNASAQSLNSVDGAVDNPNPGLGIQSVGNPDTTGDTPGQIDALVNENEFWSFSLNQSILFEEIGMNLGGMGQKIYLSSPAWNSLSITPGNSAVTFAAGQFTLTNLGPNPDIYSLAILSSGSPLLVPAGTWITIGAGDNAGARLTSISFAVVPEPTACLVWAGLFCTVTAIYKPWKGSAKNRKARETL
jgi:hypothetical protein